MRLGTMETSRAVLTIEQKLRLIVGSAGLSIVTLGTLAGTLLMGHV